ncbi:MAG: hypothetical protein AAGF12_32315 [Myxococcota bacterium]
MPGRHLELQTKRTVRGHEAYLDFTQPRLVLGDYVCNRALYDVDALGQPPRNVGEVRQPVVWNGLGLALACVEQRAEMRDNRVGFVEPWNSSSEPVEEPALHR